jgi:hypothetical protein
MRPLTEHHPERNRIGLEELKQLKPPKDSHISHFALAQAVQTKLKREKIRVLDQAHAVSLSRSDAPPRRSQTKGYTLYEGLFAVEIHPFARTAMGDEGFTPVICVRNSYGEQCGISVMIGAILTEVDRLGVADILCQWQNSPRSMDHLDDDLEQAMRTALTGPNRIDRKYAFYKGAVITETLANKMFLDTLRHRLVDPRFLRDSIAHWDQSRKTAWKMLVALVRARRLRSTYQRTLCTLAVHGLIERNTRHLR